MLTPHAATDAAEDSTARSSLIVRERGLALCSVAHPARYYALEHERLSSCTVNMGIFEPEAIKPNVRIPLYRYVNAAKSRLLEVCSLRWASLPALGHVPCARAHANLVAPRITCGL